MSDMSPVLCPLSGEPADLVEELPVAVLVDAYRALLGPGTGPEFGPEFAGLDVIRRYSSPVTGFGFYGPESPVGDAAFYERLARIPWYYTDDKWDFATALALVPRPGRTLELGSGRGAFLRRVTALGAEAVGIETNTAAAAEARQAGATVWDRRIEALAREMPGEFDTVAAFQVLEHLPDPLTALRAACDLLRPGGTLLLSVPNNDSLLFARFDPLNAPPHHLGLWNVQSLLWLQRALPVRAFDLRFEPLSDHLSPADLASVSARTTTDRSRRRRLARRVLGERRVASLAAPELRAALQAAPGHSVLVAFRRV